MSLGVLAEGTAMKNRSYFVTIFLATVVALSGSGSPAAEAQSANVDAMGSLASLRSELLAVKDDQAKIDMLKKIVGVREKEASAFLREYFLSLPLPEASTNPHSDSFREMALGVILPALGGRERDVFLVAVIRREVDGLREAASFGADNKYPGGVWEKALSVVERDGASDEVWQELIEVGNDKSVPDRLRVAVKTRLSLKDIGKDESSISKGIRSVIDKLPLRPMTSVIPYDIYND